jgi:hypothetical protein
MAPRSSRAFAALAASWLVSCATPPGAAPPPAASSAAAIAPPQTAVLRRADADRVRALEFELERLRADLRAAEETLLAVESGMRGAKGRAEAVSALAEARIAVERAARAAPWRADAIQEAREKLAEAERQLAAEHLGSAIFFVSRAQRIAGALEEEARGVAANAATRFIAGSRVNLRAAPDVDSEVLATLVPGFPVFVEESQGGWSLVRTAAGRVGFVRSDLLTRR